MLSAIYGNATIEQLDWNLRKETREKIVALVKEGKLKPNQEFNQKLCALNQWKLPPISNGGNEISITKSNKNKVIPMLNENAT